MYSFFIYFSIIFFSTFFLWLAEQISSKPLKWLFSILSFLVVFFPSAIRYGVGTDFFNYLTIYDYVDEARKNEFGFYVINEFLKYLGLNSAWAIAAYAFLFTFVAYIAYPKKNKWLFHLLFMSMLLFFSFNGIRQAISLSFILLAFKYVLEKSQLKHFVFLILATMFHQSAMFLIFVSLLVRIPVTEGFKNKVFPLIVISISLLVWIGPSFVSIIELVASKLNLPYLHYFESAYFEKVRTNSGYVVLLKVFLLLALLIRTKALLEISERYWIVIFCAGLYAISYSLASQSAAFGRVSYVFVPSVVYFIYLWALHLSRKNIATFSVWIATLLLYILPYFTTALGADNYESDNYYRTIFNKEF